MLGKVCIGLFLILWVSSACTRQHLFQSADPVYTSDTLYQSEFHAYEYILKTQDKLSISVWNHNDLSIGSVFDVYSSDESYGKYLTIDHEGKVSLPLVGSVKLAGFTIKQAGNLLAEVYSDYVKEPVVTLHIHGLQATILGEVNQPGSYPIDKESISLLQLVGKAGGFTNYSDNTIIKIIRKEEPGYGIKGDNISIVDLTQTHNLTHDKLLIRPEDIVYVDAKKGKEIEKTGARLIPYVGLISSIALIFSILK